MSRSTPAGAGSPPPSRGCRDGLTIVECDLLCPVSDIEIGDSASPQPYEQAEAAVVDGWLLGRRLTAMSLAHERFLTRRLTDGRPGVLTLYRADAEPDPSVYEVIRRLPREHVAEIIGSGSWKGRAYEIEEELTEETLADVGHLGGSVDVIRRIADQVGRALNALSEVGLRHLGLRPSTVLVRNREPLDLVVAGFGSARLAEYDREIVSSLETSRYMAPETVAGSVAGASDWWSLGMVLLEQVTNGACFEGVSDQAFLIRVMVHGPPIPADIEPILALLLRGLLAHDPRQRWQWKEVKEWRDGKTPATAPSLTAEPEKDSGPTINVAGRAYRTPIAFTLAAAEAAQWDEASQLFQSGAIATWATEANLGAAFQANIQGIQHLSDVSEDLRLSLALKVLTPAVPLVVRGSIITPGWLLEHPAEGYRLITGPVPGFLQRIGTEAWLVSLSLRAAKVHERAKRLAIALDEDAILVHLLATSQARLAALWEQRRRILSSTEHAGLASLMGHRQTTAEDLVLLLGAKVSQFCSTSEIIAEAARIAEQAGLGAFDRVAGEAHLAKPRRELYRDLDRRLADFVRCGIERIDECADQFRLERRMSMAGCLVLLAVPQERWQEPPPQEYVSNLLDFFSRKVASAALRGPLIRMMIETSTLRVDLTELGSDRIQASVILDRLLARSSQMIAIDTSVFDGADMLERRVRSLHRRANLYHRDTGIDGLYLGFPFLLMGDPRGNTKPRIAPVLLWPMRLELEVGNRGQVALGFDGQRDEVRLNPAFEGMMGSDATRRWKRAVRSLLRSMTLTVAEVTNAFGPLARLCGTTLIPLPKRDVEVQISDPEVACAAVLFLTEYGGQAIAKDLRELKGKPLTGTALEMTLRLGGERPAPEPAPAARESERYFMVDSDPSQEQAVLEARREPGLLIEGPPGTGKSQTIVHIAADAIARRKSLLVICQKHTALDVVRKRLEAEGLGRRIVILTDVNRDREAIIRQIDEQVDELLARPSAGIPVWQRDRERTAVRVEALEGELDRFNEALHRRDDTTGISYRVVLSELIALENGARPPIDAPSLRSILGDLDQIQLADTAERCARLVPDWLPAKFEDSPLAVLRPFTPDRVTVVACLEALLEFVNVEITRKVVIAQTMHAFPIDDPAPYAAWIDQYRSRFESLNEDGWGDLHRWGRLFRVAAGSSSLGASLLRELTSIAEGVSRLPDDAYDAKLSPAAARLSAKVLAELATDAERFAAPMFEKLNPRHWSLGQRLRPFLEDCGASIRMQPERIDAVFQREHALRPLRKRLAAVYDVLLDGGRIALAALSPSALRSLIDETRRSVSAVDQLVYALDTFPPTEEALSASEVASPEAFAALMEQCEHTLARDNARADSRAALGRLKAWFNDEWLAGCEANIGRDAANSEAIAALREGLPSIAAYQRFQLRASDLGAGDCEILRRLRASEMELSAIPMDELEAETRRLIEREGRLAWKARMEDGDPVLLLTAAEIRRKVASFVQAKAEMRNFNRQTVIEDVDMRGLKGRREWEAITRPSGNRRRRLREFVDAGIDLGLLAMRPVWLMNPDTASRVLPLRCMFDIVVFDEASQMPVEYALPTLYRAKGPVIIGDEKQLPPTSFFSSNVENDGAELIDDDELEDVPIDEERDTRAETWDGREIKDCPDLLDLAREMLPRATLETHYRSAYRELIDFSGVCFYAGRLNSPVQRPRDQIREAKPVEYEFVDDGLYENQINRKEAERITAILRSTWRDLGPRPSIGVVTSNRKQADLINELLEEAADSDAMFRLILAAEGERVDDDEDKSFFVKCVENVQGDERDIIVFSTTFGRDAAGDFRRFFGTLGQTAGDRRLNVAITRARRKVIVVSSMPINEVSGMLTTHRTATPPDYLQAYLEYARALSAGEFDTADVLLARLAGNRMPADDAAAADRNGFRRVVADFIADLGWPTLPIDHDDAFGVDLAIIDPRTGLYGIGIECDTPRHRMLAHAHAREIWRRRVLEGTFPYVYRVLSKGWYDDRKKEQADLRHAIEEALGKRGLQ